MKLLTKNKHTFKSLKNKELLKVKIIEGKKIKPKTPKLNKYTAGVVGNDAGELKTAVAAYYTASAASLMGPGLINIKYKKDIYNILSTLCPFAVFKDDNCYIDKATALIIGPGLINGCDLSVLEKGINTVIDAGGILELKKHIDLLELYGKNIILTPHTGEFARLLDLDAKEIENNRIKYAKEFSLKYNTTIVLKGANTVVASMGQVFINTNDSPSLATAGSGDILAGIIGGLLGYGYSILDAATLGVYIHGNMGIIAKEKYGICVNANTLLDVLPKAINKL